MRLHWILICSSFFFFSSLKNEVSLSDYYTRIKGKIRGTPVEFSLQDSANKTVTLSQFRGKFVVICMEANWCRPCIGELNPTRELQANLLGQNVVWVFISFDRDKESWDEARRSNNLKGIHLWGKPKSEELKKIFCFDSLPYYVWVDHSGIIVMDDAPRPSSRSTLKQLRLYLTGR